MDGQIGTYRTMETHGKSQLDLILQVYNGAILAYETARLRGCDIDQPRNLAKTVTVQ